MTLFEALQPHLGKQVVDVIENTIIEQHRSAAKADGDTKHSIEYIIVFEDGARVIVK